jgi:hypothetical protein
LDSVLDEYYKHIIYHNGEKWLYINQDYLKNNIRTQEIKSKRRKLFTLVVLQYLLSHNDHRFFTDKK